MGIIARHKKKVAAILIRVCLFFQDQFYTIMQKPIFVIKGK